MFDRLMKTVDLQALLTRVAEYIPNIIGAILHVGVYGKMQERPGCGQHRDSFSPSAALFGADPGCGGSGKDPIRLRTLIMIGCRVCDQEGI